jgi:TRAP-type mannitol/chloroaromatic compound transport system permease large subunit
MGQFMVLQLIGLAICIMFPSISLWFPRYLFGK